MLPRMKELMHRIICNCWIPDEELKAKIWACFTIVCPLRIMLYSFEKCTGFFPETGKKYSNKLYRFQWVTFQLEWFILGSDFMFVFTLLVEVFLFIQARFFLHENEKLKNLSLCRMMIFDATMIISWGCCLYTTFFFYDFERNSTWPLLCRYLVRELNFSVIMVPLVYQPFIISLTKREIFKSTVIGPAQEVHLDLDSTKSSAAQRVQFLDEVSTKDGVAQEVQLDEVLIENENIF